MDKFYKFIQPVYGKECTHVGRWFSTMILIDFGRYYPPTIGQKHGIYDWSLSIGDSWWELSMKNKIIVGNGNSEKEINQRIKQLEGKHLENITASPDFSKTSFSFNDNLLLVCKHKSSNKYEDWSLARLDKTYLQVGPKHKWKLVPGTDMAIW